MHKPNSLHHLWFPFTCHLLSCSCGSVCSQIISVSRWCDGQCSRLTCSPSWLKVSSRGFCKCFLLQEVLPKTLSSNIHIPNFWIYNHPWVLQMGYQVTSVNMPGICRSHWMFLQPSPCPRPGAGAQQMEQCSCSEGCWWGVGACLPPFGGSGAASGAALWKSMELSWSAPLHL